MKRFNNDWKIAFSALAAHGFTACAFLTETPDWIIPAFLCTLAAVFFSITNRTRKVDNAR